MLINLRKPIVHKVKYISQNHLKRNKPVVIFFTIIFITVFNTGLFSNDKIYRDEVLKDGIKTVQLYREGWEMSYPFFRLGEDISLVLGFDELGSEVHNYSYKIIHCTKDWAESPILWNEYLEEMPFDETIEYEFSINTSYNYIHYELKIPNENVDLKISGNYAIVVYEDYNEEDIVFVKRFMVYEDLVSLKARVERPKQGQMIEQGQELELELIIGSYNIADPYSEIQINITQNYDWNTLKKITAPSFVKPETIDYNLQDNLLFYGRDEFEHIDIKSTRFISDKVDSIEFINPYYHAYLFADIPEPYRLYFYDIDINGKYLIRRQEGNDQNLEPDYVNVHFVLKEDNPSLNIHISGNLTQWNINKNSRMEYNTLKKQYEKILLLKQGYYNYRYVCVDENLKYIDCKFEEGNYFETENDYYFMIYHSPMTLNYDRLIGFKITNSNKEDK